MGQPKEKKRKRMDLYGLKTGGQANLRKREKTND